MPPKPKPIAERFWPKVEKTDSCWIWKAFTWKGYGYMNVNVNGKRQPMQAYRVSYELLKGPVPKGMELDHLCRVRSCVNPDHLEIVTPLENWRRGASPSAQRARSQFCKRGHLLAGDNVYPRKNSKGHCLTCSKMMGRKHYLKTYVRKTGRPYVPQKTQRRQRSNGSSELLR